MDDLILWAVVGFFVLLRLATLLPYND